MSLLHYGALYTLPSALLVLANNNYSRFQSCDRLTHNYAMQISNMHSCPYYVVSYHRVHIIINFYYNYFVGQQTTHDVLQIITGQFTSLLDDVQLSLEVQQVKVSEVQKFLLSLFHEDFSIPEACDIAKIFSLITEGCLWHYDHYGPLKELSERFLPGDKLLRQRFAEYERQLCRFITSTKIVDYITVSKQTQASSKAHKKHFRKLMISLKVDKTVDVSEMTMDFVDTFWKEFVNKLGLSKLGAVIDEIVKDGSGFNISWFILPHDVVRIRATFSKALRFYQLRNVCYISADQSSLYNVEEIVSVPIYLCEYLWYHMYIHVILQN